MPGLEKVSEGKAFKRPATGEVESRAKGGRASFPTQQAIHRCAKGGLSQGERGVGAGGAPRANRRGYGAGTCPLARAPRRQRCLTHEEVPLAQVPPRTCAKRGAGSA